MLYLGIDQHARQITVSLRDEQGDVLQARQVSTRPEKVRAFFAKLTEECVREQESFIAVVEVCGFNDWLIRMLHEVGCHKVILTQPEERKQRKTDRRDASALSELLWVNRDRFLAGKPVRGLRQVDIPSQGDQENRRLTTLRKEASQTRTRLLNKIKHILRRHNRQWELPTKTFPTQRAIAWLKQLDLPEMDRLEMDYLLADLEQAEQRLQELEQLIVKRCGDMRVAGSGWWPRFFLKHGSHDHRPPPGRLFQQWHRMPYASVSSVGRGLDAKSEAKWLWKGRRVYLFDGTTVSMPDTPENQNAYPQTSNQKPGLGFPIARIAAVFSLSCGTVLDLGICRYAGKGQSELGMLRLLWHIFQPGDVMLADRLMCSWTEMVMLQQRGVDCVCRFNPHRKADFRRGRRLGPYDHIVTWSKPQKPRSRDRETYKALPDSLTVREIRGRILQPGFRTATLTVATTLLDANEFSANDLATMYRARWNAELDLRSIKSTMQMDILRCKTPELVRKEIWTHILAYNLIRTVMAQAAAQSDIEPRTISFKGALQTLEAFQPLIDFQGHRGADFRRKAYDQLLTAIAMHRVADRPDRFEPRYKKRRSKRYAELKLPRQESKLTILKGLVKN